MCRGNIRKVEEDKDCEREECGLVRGLEKKKKKKKRIESA